MKKLFISLGLLVLGLFVVILSQHFYTESKVSSLLSREVRHIASANLPAAEIDEVWGPEQDRIADYIADDSIEVAKKNQSGPLMKRDAHPKHHGCVRAHLHIDNSQLPGDYRYGLFAGYWTDKEAWVRFSNGSPNGADADDQDADVRGMAVKILNVPGTPSGNHDLIMMSSERFFSKNAKDYIRLVQALNSGKLSLISYFAMNPRNLSIINSARTSYNNPLLITYSSAVPYKLNSYPMRFRMVPCSSESSAAQNVALSYEGKNAMSVDLKNSVEAGDSCFDFQVQINEDLENNPTEDPRLEWSEEQSPSYSVGTLTIKQDADFADYGQFCENISFNPWNSLPEQRPLGQINRIRQVAYRAMSEFRHQSNKTPEIEPRDLYPCKNSKTAALCK